MLGSSCHPSCCETSCAPRDGSWNSSPPLSISSRVCKCLHGQRETHELLWTIPFPGPPGALDACRQAGSELDDKLQRDRKAVRASLAVALSLSNKAEAERAALSPAPEQPWPPPAAPSASLRWCWSSRRTEFTRRRQKDGEPRSSFRRSDLKPTGVCKCIYLSEHHSFLSFPEIKYRPRILTFDLWHIHFPTIAPPPPETGRRTSSCRIDTVPHQDCERWRDLVKSDIADILLSTSDTISSNMSSVTANQTSCPLMITEFFDPLKLN